MVTDSDSDTGGVRWDIELVEEVVEEVGAEVGAEVVEEVDVGAGGAEGVITI